MQSTAPTAGVKSIAPDASGGLGARLWRGIRPVTTPRGIAMLLLVAVGYAFAARISLVFMLQPQNIAGIWPPAGLALGALILAPVNRWPLVLGGVAIAVVAANLDAGVSPGMTVGFTVANTVAPLAAAVALRRTGFTSFGSVRGVGLFVACGVLGGPAIGGLIGAAAAAIGSGAPFLQTWLTWLIGDAGGVLTVAPILIVAAANGLRPAMSRWRVVEAVAIAAMMLGITILAFFPVETDLQLAAYPVFLLLVVVGVRFGAAGAALATVTIGSLVMIGTLGGHGPIALLNPGLAIQTGQAQILVAVIFLSSMITAAAMAERQAAIEALAMQMTIEADRAARRERIAAFARQIAQSLEENLLFHHVVQAAGDVVPADIIQLTVKSLDGDAHTVAAAVGAPEVIGRVIEPGDGVTGAVIRDGVPVSVARADVNVRALAMRDVLPTVEVSLACAPIRSGGTVVATLGLARLDLATPFEPDELRALEMMCDLAGLALTNSHEFGRVQESSIRDALTGLPNRRYFNLTFEQLAAQRTRQPADKRLEVSAIIFDLDHFGAVNKERGHGTGDRVLAGFGSIMAARLRRADIVARYGGEEFVAVLVGTNREGAVQVAEDIRTAFAESTFLGDDGAPIRCTVSAGVSTVPTGEDSMNGLVATADVALSMAKRAGRNQVIAA